MAIVAAAVTLSTRGTRDLTFGKFAQMTLHWTAWYLLKQ